VHVCQGCVCVFECICACKFASHVCVTVTLLISRYVLVCGYISVCCVCSCVRTHVRAHACMLACVCVCVCVCV